MILMSGRDRLFNTNSDSEENTNVFDDSVFHENIPTIQRSTLPLHMMLRHDQPQNRIASIQGQRGRQPSSEVDIPNAPLRNTVMMQPTLSFQIPFHQDWVQSSLPDIEPTPIGPMERLLVVQHTTLKDCPTLLQPNMMESIVECLRPLTANSNVSGQAFGKMLPLAARGKTGSDSASCGGGNREVWHSTTSGDRKKSPSNSSPKRVSHEDQDMKLPASTPGPAALKFRESHLEQWDQKYQELLQFRQAKGHCLVPFSYKPNQTLSHWVKRQRCQYKLKMDGKRSTLTNSRQGALERLGFIWDSHQAAWEMKFQDLCAFKIEFGHCNVPTSYPKNPQLAMWLKTQRRQLRLYHRDDDDDYVGDQDEDDSFAAIGEGADTSKEKRKHKQAGKKLKSSLSSTRVAKLLQLGVTWQNKKKTKRTD